VRRWAERSVRLAPNDPAAWLAYGDVEVWFARPTHHHRNELACWPTAAVDAYQRALRSGSPAADTRLKAFNEIPSWMVELKELAPQPCPARAVP
jgi:hypothetical protein